LPTALPTPEPTNEPTIIIPTESPISIEFNYHTVLFNQVSHSIVQIFKQVFNFLLKWCKIKRLFYHVSDFFITRI
jgi:hypothetical protein